MKLTLLLSALLAIAVNPSDFRQALNLYENGMYERARTMFEELKDDPLGEGYVVLCALKMRSDDYPELITAYTKKYPGSSLTPSIHYENALRLFDQKRYQEAYSQLSRIRIKDLSETLRPEYIFKSGYCLYADGRHPEALRTFAALDGDFDSEYSGPARYLSGVITYGSQNFDTAVEWFRKAEKDYRFAEFSRFYIVDCEFNLDNYDFVISEGEKIFDSVPKERREHLARIISESYLVKGDSANAKKYYESFSGEEMTRSDYFYAASVLYAVDDYSGAVENFSRMTNRTDSLGQIANYQMGNSYVRLRNKVAALKAFKDASAVDFDPVITEDAYFNYAKLAFDLNKDTEGFTSYIKRYSTKAKGEQIYSYMALAALYDRDYAAAVAAYDNIDELDDDMRLNYAKANYLRAEQLVRNGSFRDAVPFLRASSYYIPKNDRFNQLSRYWLAESFYRSGNFAEARKNFTDLYNASALSGLDEGILLPYNIAYCFLSEQDYASAAKWFETSISSGKTSFLEDAVTRRADCDFASRDYKAAIASYQRAIDEFGSVSNVYPYYRQALAYGLSGDRKNKMAVLKAVTETPSGLAYYDEALYELGRTQMEMKSNNDAVASFRKLLNNTNDSAFEAKALIGLGMVNRNVSNYDKALEYYKEVVARMPGTEYYSDALLAIESIYQAKKQPEKYVEYLEQNSLTEGKTAEEVELMYFNTAEKVYLAGNYAQAVVSVGKYLEMYPQGAGAPQMEFYLAESYNALGDKEKACDCYAAALNSGKENSFSEMSRLKYAKLSYELERYSDAYRVYTELLNTAKLEDNRKTARLGMMRSAYLDKDFNSALSAANVVKQTSDFGKDVEREADYIIAKSYLGTSRREQALAIFKQLSADPSTPEGAEAMYILVQDVFDRGNFEQVENLVYEFSRNCGDQSYWLAKTYIILGDAFFERGKAEQAKATFESIRDGYESEDGKPDDVTETVRTRMERLENLNG